MAVAPMTKILIVSHQSQVSDLLEALQREGICQILNADQALVSRDDPELKVDTARPRQIEERFHKLQRCISFLSPFAPGPKGLAAALAPRTVVNRAKFQEVVGDENTLHLMEDCEQVETALAQVRGELEGLEAKIQELQPWDALDLPLEQLFALRRAECITGYVSSGHLQDVEAGLLENGAALQVISTIGTKCACVIVCLKETVAEVHKLLRSAEYEPVNFLSMTGTIAENIAHYRDRLARARQRLSDLSRHTESLARDILKLQILQDHYRNLLDRENTRTTAPATQHTVVLEGWVKKRDIRRLERIIASFDAASLSQITPERDEDVPVEIENRKTIRPFEVITRLYGMPRYGGLDPTLFLAPFFALFFGLCLTDAGYGLIMIGVLAYFIKKMQGDKKLLWLLMICSGTTIVAGVLTGGWFGDAIQQFIPGLDSLRQKVMWFDPFESPLTFFALALVVGYIQLQFGLLVALGFNLKERNFIAALCDQVTWIVMLNCLVVFLAAKLGAAPAPLGTLCGRIALVPAVMILLFSVREGPVGGRLGMGMYNLFSTIFWMGDTLSYLRLMALGMVSGGLAMAINVIADIARDVPYGIGYVLMILILIGGHGFNLILSILGAFVHTLRLQYVEFFPKFFTSGGKAFEPLSRQYEYIYMDK